MPNARFNLRNKSEEETLILLIFRYNGRRLVYSTGQKISPKFWNDKTQRIRESSRFEHHIEFNAYLDNLAAHTQNIYRRFINDDEIPTLEEFRKELDIATKRTEREKPITLFKFIEELSKERVASGRYSPGTTKVYITMYNHLKDYHKERRKTVDFDTIDLFFLQWADRCFDKPLGCRTKGAECGGFF